MKKSPEKVHTLYEVPPPVSKEWTRKKLVFYGVMIPAMVAIPVFLEFADIEAIYNEKAWLVTQMLSTIDLLFFMCACYYYPFMKKLVTKIDYDVKEDKLHVHQKFGSEFLGQKVTEYGPKELEKVSKRNKLNPTIGYRSLKKGENHKGLSTEHQ